MFGRRKRSYSHHQPLSTPASQSAHSAANYAFLKSQQSSSSLSSAAAAAALRNLTPTPTQVENVQTKRMAQRASSVHSNSPNASRRAASAGGPLAGGSLRRASSSGSMSSRTFRESSPSPHRPLTSSGAVHAQTPVDVPPLPDLPSQYQTKSSLVVELPVFNRQCDRLQYPQHPHRGLSDEVRVSIEAERGNQRLHRPGSRNSVNFSYPRGSRPISPTLAENRPAKVGTAVVRGDHSKATRGNQLLSEKPASPKSRKREGREESHVDSSVGPAATAVNVQRTSSPADSTRARTERLDHKLSPNSSHGHHSDPSSPITSSISAERDSITPRPSTVFKENDPEKNGDVDTSCTQTHEDRLASSSPTVDHLEVSTPQSSPSKRQEEGHIRQSSSPGRSARFSKWLSVSGDGDQIHQPPPRSVSPAKSALKHARGTSISPERKLEVGGRSVQLSSELSDGTSVASDDGSRISAKKRAAKVSFDEEAEIVGVAASPPTSPEEYVLEHPANKSKSRKSWLGASKKRSAALNFSTGDDEFDKVLKPRPVLPSFGSVRGNRDSVLQPSAMPQFSDNESTTSSSDYDAVAPGTSFSNDHAIGGIFPIAQEKETSQIHNVKSVEPTSINGQLSFPPKTPPSDIASGQPPLSDNNSYMHVPSIAVEPATPPVETDQPRDQRSSLEVYKVPGGFPPLNSGGNANAVVVDDPNLDDDTGDESDASVYSDAAEDFEGDGFGSINAIVDSRSILNSSAPLGPTSESRDTTPRPVDRTAAVDDEPKAVTDQAIENVRSFTPTPSTVNRQGEQSPAPSDSAGPTESTVSSHSTVLSKSKSQMSPVHNDHTHLDSRKKARPLSINTSPNAGQGKKRSTPLGPAFQRTGSPSLSRTMSNGSDSSSSFKRARASPRGAHGMLRTMRGSPTSPTQSRVHSISDLSDPPDFRLISAGSSAGTMRKTLRSPGSGGERYSFFSTNKKAPRAGPTSLLRPIQKSRFADSDGEEDEPQPRIYSSRFADSSDEDEPANTPMRPVRGIPRRKGTHDGDSTELEDSSEEEDGHHPGKPGSVNLTKLVRKPPGSRDSNSASNMSGMAAVARQRGMTQRELEEFIMQPSGGRKPGLLSRLGLKKPANKDHRVHKADVESPSRRDKPPERSRLEHEQLHGGTFVDDGYPKTTTTVTSGLESPKRLKKLRNWPTVGAESWPLRQDDKTDLPEPIAEQPQSPPSPTIQTRKPEPPVDNSGRASVDQGGTVRGTAIQQGLDDVTSVTSNDCNGPSARDVVIGGSGRKKRFPNLRKAFGLRA
ncbi:hypothetical protein N7495_000855 [Penicillium taxi]|uniref:uncharacterized protein n=1 Tax=Penicillium taxi TaxID=168475 RepID=UPI002545B1E5|nr:uncharacterized protein N7495_000855 [Penicillium taxi]KAJ5908173.1 hypothetical protein N7495_000855 [Penicillium taxi]